MYCRKCGEEVPENGKFCASCGESMEFNDSHIVEVEGVKKKKVKKEKTKQQKIRAGIAWGIFGLFLFAGMGEDDSSTTTAPTIMTVTEIQDYKSSCNTYDYETIFRDSSQYKGERARFVGKVVQVQYSGSKVYLRINVTASESPYGSYVSYSDTMWATYSPSSSESRILEDDILTIYGDLNGTYSYQSVLGGEITIPSINVKVLEMGETVSSTTSTDEAPIE